MSRRKTDERFIWKPLSTFAPPTSDHIMTVAVPPALPIELEMHTIDDVLYLKCCACSWPLAIKAQTKAVAALVQSLFIFNSSSTIRLSASSILANLSSLLTHQIFFLCFFLYLSFLFSTALPYSYIMILPATPNTIICKNTHPILFCDLFVEGLAPYTYILLTILRSSV